MGRAVELDDMTCTPVLLRHALRDADVAIYLDADLYFFSSPTPALDGFAKGSIDSTRAPTGPSRLGPDGRTFQRRPCGGT